MKYLALTVSIIALIISVLIGIKVFTTKVPPSAAVAPPVTAGRNTGTTTILAKPMEFRELKESYAGDCFPLRDIDGVGITYIYGIYLFKIHL